MPVLQKFTRQFQIFIQAVSETQGICFRLLYRSKSIKTKRHAKISQHHLQKTPQFPKKPIPQHKSSPRQSVRPMLKLASERPLLGIKIKKYRNSDLPRDNRLK